MRATSTFSISTVAMTACFGDVFFFSSSILLSFARVARKAHPNVYELIKQEQAHTEVSTAQLATGSQPPKRAKKFIAKDKRIDELKKRFSEDTFIG